MSASNERSNFGSWTLELSVFVCGAVVMIYEITGSRIVAPYIGTSTYIWTSLIGVILAALSLGYWVGGRTADRRPNIRVLASAIFAAAGAVSVTLLFKDLILQAIARMPAGLEIRSVLAALLLFAPASIALGFVIPYATKLRVADLDDTGKTVGRLYALSTIGSIAGTFAAGFVLIPFVGSVRTLYLLAALLFVLSVLLAGFSFNRNRAALVVIFILGIGVSEAVSYLLWRANNLYDIDTEYSRVLIFDTPDPRTDRRLKALATDPVYIQSAKYLDGEDLALEYTKFYDLIRHYKPDFEHTLMIGGAGFSYPQHYIRNYPGATMDVVEIDPQMTRIAKRFFGLADDPRLKIVHADGRVFLNSAPEAAYDAVMIDAFGSLFSVPYQLTTVEAVREMHRVLKPGGVVIFNIGSAIRGPASHFLQAEFATYRSGFADIRLFKVYPDNPDERLQNLMIVACKDTCREAGAGEISKETGSSEGPSVAELLSKIYTAGFPVEQPILTDDLAPVERFASVAHAYRYR